MATFIFRTVNIATVTMVLWIRLLVANEQKPKEENISIVVPTVQMNDNHSLIPQIFDSVDDNRTISTENESDSQLFKVPKENLSGPHKNSFTWVLQSLATTQMERSKRKTSLLHLLAEANAADAVLALLEAGVNVNASDHAGETPLHWAAKGGAYDVMKILLDMGADPNVYGSYRTPLLIAVTRDDAKAVRLIIESRPHITASSTITNNVFSTAITWRSYNVLQTFIQDVDVFSKQTLQYAWDSALSAEDSVAMRIISTAKVDEDDPSTKASMVFRLNQLTRPGREDILKRLIAAGADVNAKDIWSDETPLMTAAAHNNPKSISILVEAGARLEDVDQHMKTALLYAAEHGSVEALSVLVSLGANINATSDMGTTALHHAVKHSDTATAILLEGRIDREARNNVGMTPVFMPADQSPSALRRLLKTNVSINTHDNFNRTPLMYHIFLGDALGTDVLLDFAPDVKMRDNNGDNSLLLIAKQEVGNRWFPAFEEENLLPILKKLINLGVDVDAQDSSGKSALHWFASKDYSLTIEYLSMVGADKDIRDVRGFAPIHCAAEKGRLSALQKLLEYSVEVDTRDRRGRTALMVAAENDRASIIPTLIRAGAKIDARDDYGRTALHLAAKNALRNQDANINALRSLLHEGANTNETDIKGEIPLHCAVDHDYVLEELLRAGSDKNAQDENGSTALHLAVQKGWRLSIAILLKGEVNVNVQDKNGKTPTMFAAENNNVKTLKKLFNAGADLDARDNEGSTALHRATVNGSVNALRSLLVMAANVDIKDNNGKTPLHWASERNNLKALEALLAAGAEVNLPDGSGRTALHWAAGKGGERVVKRLIRAGADVNAEDKEGKTPLWDAVYSNDATSAALLLSAGADVNHEVQGQTLLDLASEKDALRKIILQEKKELKTRGDRRKIVSKSLYCMGRV